MGLLKADRRGLKIMARFMLASIMRVSFMGMNCVRKAIRDAAFALIAVLALTAEATAEDIVDEIEFANGLAGEQLVPAEDIEQVERISRDPLTGALVLAGEPAGEEGGNNFLRVVDKDDGSVELEKILSEDVLISALDFTPDGTMFFSVANLLIGGWFREEDVFRSITPIAGATFVETTNNGNVFITSSARAGGQFSFRDRILRINRSNGISTPVFDTEVLNEQLELDIAGIETAAVNDETGAIYAGYIGGESFVRRPNGNYAEFFPFRQDVGGVNPGSLQLGPNNEVLYQFDVAAGQLFAIDLTKDTPNRTLLSASRVFRTGNGRGVLDIAPDGQSAVIATGAGGVVRVSPEDGRTLREYIQGKTGTRDVEGTITAASGDPVPEGTEVSLSNGRTDAESVSAETRADGTYTLEDVPAGFYEVRLSNAPRGLQDDFRTLDVPAGSATLDTPGTDFEDVPLVEPNGDRLAEGLSSETLADGLDGIGSNTDVTFGPDFNSIYTTSFNNANVVRIVLDEETREVADVQTVAEGGGLRFASFGMYVDSVGNIYVSWAKEGVLRLPPRDFSDFTYQLEQSGSDPLSVVDQDGNDLVFSLITDMDGMNEFNNGDFILSSGNLGDQSAPTFDTLIRRRPDGQETIYSNGVLCNDPGGGKIWNNVNNIHRVADSDDFYVDGANPIVRVRADQTDNEGTQCVDVVWPGPSGLEGSEKEVAVLPFSQANDDCSGPPNGALNECNVFIRGGFSDAEGVDIRLIDPDDPNKLLKVAEGVTIGFANLMFDENGRSLIYPAQNSIIRIQSEVRPDGTRPTIAEVVSGAASDNDNVAAAVAASTTLASHPDTGLDARQERASSPDEDIDEDRAFAQARLVAAALQTSSASDGAGESAGTGGGGSMGWWFIATLLVLVSLRSATEPDRSTGRTASAA